MVTRQLPSSQLSCLVLDDDDYSSGGSSGSESETSVLPTAQMTVLDSAEKKAHSTAQMTDLHSALKKVLHLARTKVQLTGIRWAQKK
eukprot:scaffold14042_cov97-Skeletonema_menzelii.AAC.1